MRLFRLPSLAPLALIALPIAAAGLLAWKGAEADRAAAAARLAEAADLRLTAAAERLESVAEKHAAAAVAKVAADPAAAALHSVIARGEIAFAAVFREDWRLFPPEDSSGVTAAEASALAALGPALAAARRRLTPPGSVAWLWTAGPGEAMLLTCRRDVALTDYCAAIEETALRRPLTATLEELNAATPAWSYAVADLGDGPFPPLTTVLAAPQIAAPVFAERGLRGPLAGRRLEIRATAPFSEHSAGWFYAAVGAPSAALWAAGAWRFHQSRRAQLDEGRRRVDLAARLSHDLRTPLANLRLYVDLIRRRAADPAATAGYADILDAEINRLDHIAEAALAAATGAGGVEDLRPQSLDPLDIFIEQTSRAAPRLAAAGCPFAVTCGERGTGRFDPAVLARILSNLLDNAGKFAAGAAVETAAAMNGDTLRLSVRDHGPGLAGADPTRRGAGLGLAIVERLAAAHGGDLLLEDAGPGLRAVVRLRSATI